MMNQSPIVPFEKKKIIFSTEVNQTRQILASHQINTVCHEARCPNLSECYSQKVATFMLLGKECTRHCAFCSIKTKAVLPPPDPMEPAHIAKAAKDMGLFYVVLTMVARDDLGDGGAEHIVECITTLRSLGGIELVEILISDLEGNDDSLRKVLSANPSVLNHNVETVPRLTEKVRNKATYERSLRLLSKAKELTPHIPMKSGIMVGLGETKAEVEQTLRDLKETGCDIVTIGQYMQSRKKNLQVEHYLPKEDFDYFKRYGESIGIPYVFSSAYVRSSYGAHIVFKEYKDKIKAEAL